MPWWGWVALVVLVAVLVVPAVLGARYRRRYPMGDAKDLLAYEEFRWQWFLYHSQIRALIELWDEWNRKDRDAAVARCEDFERRFKVRVTRAMPDPLKEVIGFGQIDTAFRQRIMYDLASGEDKRRLLDAWETLPNHKAFELMADRSPN
jgi:hypothetical protein